MTAEEARLWIIKASLIIHACAFVFFALAPALGYPLYYPDAINILKIILPIFASYVGAATLFLISGQQAEAASTETRSHMLGVLVRWPISIFGIGLLAILISFPLSQRAEFTDNGMTPNTLSLLV